MANTYPEPYRSAAKDALLDPSTCYNRECVSYTAWKICETTGNWPPRTGDMNAKNWIYRLPSWGFSQVAVPLKGGKYVGVNPNGAYGHVIWFEDVVNDTTVSISEYNYDYLGNYNTRNVSVSGYVWFQVAAPPATPAPNPDPTPVPDNPSGDIQVGDTVVASGVGTADSYGGGATTADYPETLMKVIGINNNHYALNQYNQGTPGVVSDVTGWWDASQVRRA